MSKEYIVVKGNRRMIRKEVYPIQEVLKNVKFVPKFYGKRDKVDYDGDMMNMASDRYKLFVRKGVTCITCGIKGVFFAKERCHSTKENNTDKPTYHFNLYGIDENGDEVLITKDHTIPKARGGEDRMSNYQTMCEFCNAKKGSTVPEEENK